MRKISDITSTATPDGEFTNGSVASGVSPTILDADWFNVIQRELVALVLGSGLTLDEGNDGQVLASVKKMFARLGVNSDITDLKKLNSMVLSGGTLNGVAAQADILAGTAGKVVDASALNGVLGTGLASTSGYFTVPVVIGGVLRKFYVQWINRLSMPMATDTAMGTATWTFPVAFPNAALCASASMSGVTTYYPSKYPVATTGVLTNTSVVVGSGYTASTSSISVIAIGY